MSSWSSFILNAVTPFNLLGTNEPVTEDKPKILPSATSNLRRYLAKALLPLMPLGQRAPPMPPAGHQSHSNKLTVRPERYRFLESIHGISESHFHEYILEFANNHVPSDDLGIGDVDRISGEQFTVDIPGEFAIPERIIGHSSDLDRVCRWIQELPFGTIQRALHIIFPLMAEWTFSPQPDDIDKDIFRTMMWCRPHVDDSVKDPSLCVFIQPPWIVSSKDFQLFVECLSLHPPDIRMSKLEQPPYNSRERMWAKIWDSCYRRRCHWFVVTTYWGWAFGAFSKGWTRGYITAVQASHRTYPTVLECLFYWTGSALGVPGGWTIPEVPEPVQNKLDSSETDIGLPMLTQKFSSVEPSESNWSAYSDARDETLSNGPGDDVSDFMLSPGVGNLILPDGPGNIPNRHQNVQSWESGVRKFVLARNAQQHHMSPAARTEVSFASETSAASTPSTTSTVMDFTGKDNKHGQWYSSGSAEHRNDVC